MADWTDELTSFPGEGEMSDLVLPTSELPKRDEEVFGTRILSQEDTRRMWVLLLEEHPTFLSVCQTLWPSEFGSRSSSQNSLRTRLNNTRTRCLPIIKSVWENPTLEEYHSSEGQMFFQELRRRFKTFNEVEAQAKRWKPGRRSEERQKTQLFGRKDRTDRAAKPQGRLAPSTETMGFAEEIARPLPERDRRADVLKAALMGPDLNRYRIASQTKILPRELPLILGEALRIYKRAEKTPKKRLADEFGFPFAFAVRQVRAKHPGQSLAQILQKAAQTRETVPFTSFTGEKD